MNKTAIDRSTGASGGLYGEHAGKALFLVVSMSGAESGQLLRFILPAFVVVLLVLVWKLRGMYLERKAREAQISGLQSDVKHLEETTIKLTVQNDWLVTEMHHRVKNNLQILSSLINGQLAFITDKIGREALYNSKHRLYALNLVHQQLFQHAMASTIEVSCCIRELVDYLADEFQSGKHIRFELDLVHFQADAVFAIPFELIINEMLTNSLKFAFPDGRVGVVKISLSELGDRSFQLVYSDDGIGLPEDVDLNSGRSLGRSLIMGLARQIKAQVTVDNSSGLEIRMNFRAPLQPAVPF